jgi:hypothetical protein
MGNEVEFIDGLSAKAPPERAPEYVKAKLSIKREKLIAWLQARDGEWVNAEVKVSQNGKWYVAVDAWKPEQKDRGTDRPTQPAPAVGSDFSDLEDVPF